MKAKLYIQNKHWIAGLYKGKGGISSCVHYIKSKKFVSIFKVFTVKNIITAYNE